MDCLLNLTYHFQDEGDCKSRTDSLHYGYYQACFTYTLLCILIFIICLASHHIYSYATFTYRIDKSKAQYDYKFYRHSWIFMKILCRFRVFVHYILVQFRIRILHFPKKFWMPTRILDKNSVPDTEAQNKHFAKKYYLKSSLIFV